MKFRLSIFNVYLMTLSPFILAQDLPEIIPPSPTVANLMQFEEVPISYYTGQPNIEIPIFSKQISGNLLLNIALQYNTQGVKINNTSSWTGTSWSLMAGGSISRTVRGEPDEIKKGPTNKTGILHNDDYWNYENLNSADKTFFNFHVIGSNVDKFDNEPDLYQFNFMGYSGRFVILKNGSTLEPHFISKTGKFKIDISHNIDYEISAFTVTDPMGYIYTFDVVETSSTIPFTGRISQGDSSSANVSASTTNLNYNVKSAWHLRKVELSNGNDLLTFSYQDVQENYIASANRISNKIINYGSGYNNLVGNSYNQSILEPAESIVYQNITSTTKKLDVITFVQDNTQIHFSLDMNYTHPETNGRTLKTIEIKNGSSLNKTFTLSYEETIDNSLAPITLKRLWLTKLTETAGTINHDYVLNYFNKQDLPGFNKDDIRGDSWGYYSGINLDLMGCNNISFDDNIIKTGLLTSIEYPTGGVKEFEFEHNAYSYYQDQTISFNDYIKNPRNNDLQSQIVNNFEYNHSGQSAPTVTIDTFTLDFDQDIFVSSWMDPSPYLNDHIIKIFNGTYEVFVTLDKACTEISNVPAGTYTMALAPYNNLNNFPYTISGDFQIFYNDEQLPLKQEMIGGGVRIKEIRFRENALSNYVAKKLKYVYEDENNPSLSSGVVDALADRLERNFTMSKNTSIATYLEPTCQFAASLITYQVKEKSVNIELSQGNYVGYRHVKVFEEGNGYTTMSYTSPYDYPSTSDSFDYEQPRPRENLDYKRGLLLNQTIYNQNGDILKETSYLDDLGNPNYEFEEITLFKDYNVFRPNCQYMQFYTDWDFYISGNAQNPVIGPYGPCPPSNNGSMPCGSYPVLSQFFRSGWAKLLGTTTKEYFYDSNNNQSVIESRQEFQYNPNNYQISQLDTYYDKLGVDEHLRVKYYFPVGSHLGSNSTTIVNKLIALNKVNEALETQSFRNGAKISEQHTIYNEFHPDLVLPKEIKSGKENELPETRLEFVQYDTYGNPLELKKANGAAVCYIYGFNNSLPVAKLSNTTYNDISNISNNGLNSTNNLTPINENNLRNGLPNALISFYRYDPLKGVISTSDERGYETTYEYDAFNRLHRVKDDDGNILSENEYHYFLQY